MTDDVGPATPCPRRHDHINKDGIRDDGNDKSGEHFTNALAPTPEVVV